MKSQTCEHNPIIKWIASVPAEFITSGGIVIDDDSTISAYILFRYKHIVFFSKNDVILSNKLYQSSFFYYNPKIRTYVCIIKTRTMPNLRCGEQCAQRSKRCVSASAWQGWRTDGAYQYIRHRHWWKIPACQCQGCNGWQL